MEGPCADKNMRPWARASPRLCLARRHSQRCLLFISAVCLLQTGGLPTPFPSWVEIRAADRPSRPTPLYLPRCPGNHTTPTVTKQPWLGWIPRLHAAGVRTSVCKWILCYAMLCVCVCVCKRIQHKAVQVRFGSEGMWDILHMFQGLCDL